MYEHETKFWENTAKDYDLEVVDVIRLWNRSGGIYSRFYEMLEQAIKEG